MGNYCTQTSTFQTPICQNFCVELHVSNWPRETMMNGKFPAQKTLFDHPNVALGRHFVDRVLRNNLAATFGRDIIFQQKRHLPTNNLSAHGVTSKICPSFCSFLAATHTKHCPPQVSTNN